MGGIFSGVGSSGSVGPTSGGKVYAYSALTTLTLVAPANTARRSITFHNPGPIDIMISMLTAFTSAAGVTPSTLVPTTAAYGGSFRVYANGGEKTFVGEIQQAWQALTTDGSAGQLTVMDSNT